MPARSKIASRVGGARVGAVAPSPPAPTDVGILTGALIRGPEYGTNPASGQPYVDAPWGSDTSDLFELHAGKGLSVIHYGQPWRSGGVNQSFFPGPADLCRANGSYPFIDWTPWQTSPSESYIALSQINAGNFDSYITSYAQAIGAWGFPIFIRPMWEMNGTWFTGWSPAAAGGPSAAAFVSAWRRIVGIFRTYAPKATFVWCPNVIRNQAGTVVYPLTGLYPGDDVVDWVGMDGYCWGSIGLNLSFTDTFQATYDAIYALAAASKPLMIGEWGCHDVGVIGGSKSAWIADAFAVLKAATAMPRIRAVVWFNRTSDGGNWRIEQGSGAQSAYAAGVTSDTRFRSAEFGAATTGPIPAPAAA